MWAHTVQTFPLALVFWMAPRTDLVDDHVHNAWNILRRALIRETVRQLYQGDINTLFAWWYEPLAAR
jgi:hypothetical protein